MADQFSLQFAVSCEGWLLPALQGFLLAYKAKQTHNPEEKAAEIHHSGELKMLPCLAIAWYLVYNTRGKE